MKAAIFDLDGTLLDTLEDLYLSVNYTLNKYGFPARTREEIRSFVGNGVPMLIRRALPESVGEECFLDALSCFKEYYREHNADNTRPYMYIKEALAALRERGIKIGVVSNKVDFATRALCNGLLPGLIDEARGHTEDIPVKPDPTSTHLVMRTLGAEECVYVGDSDVDILTARAAGLSCVSVSWGFKPRKLLESCGAEYIAETPEQMLSYILDVLKEL